MEVQVAETGPCSRSLHIKVPPHLVDEHLNKLYASAQQQAQIKGFRQGKVPRALIEKKFGAGILAEAKEQLLNRYFGEACRGNDINPIGRIEIDDFDSLAVKRGSALEFTARIDVRPAFELGDAKGIEVPAYVAEATDEDIDNALKEIAHQKRSIGTVAEPAADGDFVKADMTFVAENGDTVRERKGAQLNTRVPINGCDEAAYGEAVLSVTAGQEVEVAITFPPNFEKEEVRGTNGTVKLKVLEVLRVQPAPIDDELAKGMEFEDLAALRDDMRVRISAEKERVGRQQQEEAALQHLIDNHRIELPPSLVEEQKQASLHAFEHRLREAGAPDEEVRQKLAASDNDAKEEAERRVRLFFLIEELARKNELSVEQADFAAELEAIAAANNVTAAQVHQHLEENNRLGELRLALLERKVRDFLRENATAVDKKGS
ncbi:MAG: trigger factor [Planctomycetes bacterium]|nr:trigger factor [Planctomycetota bacterium]